MNDNELGWVLFHAIEPGMDRSDWDDETGTRIMQSTKQETIGFAKIVANALRRESPWKRCVDCFPPYDMGVLICLGNIQVTAGYYFHDEKGFRDLNCPKEPLLVGITHWCEMPMAAENYAS